MNSNSFRGWVLVIGVLVILGVSATQVVRVVNRSASQAEAAIRPVSDLTSGVATQVAQILYPTPTILPDPVTVVRQVRALARLETIQYSLEKVIVAETNQGPFGFLFGDRLLLIAHGLVIAGIDLEKLGTQSLRLEDGTLYVQLPDAEVFIATLDNEKSYIYDRDRGILTRGSVNLETEARRAAEREIADGALEDGILDKARQNAETFLYRFFLELGYRDVVFLDPTPVP